ncbi:TonB-dependent receptor domain-containing protein, partial [Rhodopseudomonas palustris]
FGNKFDNLIDFATDAANPLGHYINVSQAETYGLELGGDIELMPGLLRFKAAYTYLHAVDLATNLTLSRRPRDVTRLSLAITPTDKWLIEPRVTMVSKRFSSADERNPLDPYTRVDLFTEYKLDANWKLFARGENILNAHYQEVVNLGTTGPAAYAGFNATW